MNAATQDRSVEALTVGDLIAKLSNYPADMLVLVAGYEGGYEDPTLREQTVVYAPPQPWYEGDYQSISRGPEGTGGVRALVVDR